MKVSLRLLAVPDQSSVTREESRGGDIRVQSGDDFPHDSPSTPSSNHLVGGHQQFVWHGEPERLRGGNNKHCTAHGETQPRRLLCRITKSVATRERNPKFIGGSNTLRRNNTRTSSGFCAR